MNTRIGKYLLWGELIGFALCEFLGNWIAIKHPHDQALMGGALVLSFGVLGLGLGYAVITQKGRDE